MLSVPHFQWNDEGIHNQKRWTEERLNEPLPLCNAAAPSLPFFNPFSAAAGSWRHHQLYPCIRWRLQTSMPACFHLPPLPLMLPGGAEEPRGPLCQMWGTGSVRAYPLHRWGLWGIVFFWFQPNSSQTHGGRRKHRAIHGCSLLQWKVKSAVRIEEDSCRKCIWFYFHSLSGWRDSSGLPVYSSSCSSRAWAWVFCCLHERLIRLPFENLINRLMKDSLYNLLPIPQQTSLKQVPIRKKKVLQSQMSAWGKGQEVIQQSQNSCSGA